MKKSELKKALRIWSRKIGKQGSIEAFLEIIHPRNKMKLNDLCQEAYMVAKDKGFYDGKQTTALEYHMLFVSEVAEATEEVRKGNPDVYQNIPIVVKGELPESMLVPTEMKTTPERQLWQNFRKPEGEAIELCDVIIRIADYFAFKGWDMEKLVEMKMAYNKTRSYRNGGKVI